MKIIVSLALKWGLKKLKQHPEWISFVADRIPGDVDDAILRRLIALIP